MSKNYKFDSILICDDIRKEITGKFIAIGIYDNIIYFTDLPAKKSFYGLLLGKSIISTDAEIAIDFTAVEKDKSSSFKGRLEIVKEKRFVGEWSDFVFPFLIPPINYECEGQLVVKSRPLDGKRWVKLIERDIRKYTPPPN